MSTKRKREPYSPEFTEYLRAMIALGKAVGPMLKRGYSPGIPDRRYDQAVTRINHASENWDRAVANAEGKRS